MDDHTHLLADQVQDVEELLTRLLSRIKQETHGARRERNRKIPDRDAIGLGRSTAPIVKTAWTCALSEKWETHKNSPCTNALKNELSELSVFLLTSNFSPNPDYS
jgi:hypothetical protein